MRFEELQLHDATINCITYLWEAKALSVIGECFSREGGKVVGFTLTFDSVTGVSIPHIEEWGPSSCINSANFKPPLHHYIEMQSGDVIAIEAAGFKFSA
ncbi:hypothetical protein HHE92_19330 [Pseudoalteromonas arctica]|uniref:hypothetical protein n=1 Tax=Pseudoalteromonas arctica TaxID=394751 RepID=UPI00145C3A04|nr:hypothetical protein [Pseudoalteromonas arctica]NMP81937.1 hypothetical protein [Pseudoalteromonas arctica]